MQTQKEILNLTSRQKNVGFHAKRYKDKEKDLVVELQPKHHQKMMSLMELSETSFNVEPISVLKDLVMAYEPNAVILDDETDFEGAIEVITIDLKKDVFVESEIIGKVLFFPAVI